MKPDPLVLTWQGRQLRIRHDDPHLGPYTHAGQVIRAAVELASDVEGLRLVLSMPRAPRRSPVPDVRNAVVVQLVIAAS